MSDHDDRWDRPPPCDPASPFDDDDDERAEAIEQYAWGLEVQAEVALMSNRQPL